MKLLTFVFPIIILSLPAFSYDTVTFQSEDSLTITADIYMIHENSAPFIILFHQAGFSRGEYREIVPKLNDLGFNTMAVDQRSGEAVNDVVNETARRAREQNLADSYLDAWPDLMASIAYTQKNLATGDIILWGSSYSAALVLKIGGDHPDLTNGIIAFSPGEYSERLGKSTSFIGESARNIQVPVFITSARDEKERWWGIYQEIPSQKEFFLPDTDGVHGSRALWSSTDEHNQYWQALQRFLEKFTPVTTPAAPQNLKEIK